MKTILKPLMLGTALSAVGLCFTLANAAVQLSAVQSNQNLTVVKYSFASPKHNTKLTNVNKIQNINTLNSFINKPLLNLSLPVLAEFSSQKFHKKNELFEMATIFNDKLQQLLTTFSANKPTMAKSPSDEQKDFTSINLTSNCQS